MASPILEHFVDDGVFPNSRLPLLIYRNAIAPQNVTPEALEALFQGNGWPPQWRSGIYPFHHFHSTAHEALGIASGEAHLMLGGPKGREVDVSAGDVVVIPAGVGHRRLSATSNFLVVGAYPPGQHWDLLKGAPGERPKADHHIAKVPMPQTDPVEGKDGALMKAWG